MKPGAALIVADVTDDKQRAETLWAQLNRLMADGALREQYPRV